jgi:hypothetical protein
MTANEGSSGWWSRTWKALAALGTIVALVVGLYQLISLIPHHPPAFASSPSLGVRAEANEFVTFLWNHQDQVVTLSIQCPSPGGPDSLQGACQADVPSDGSILIPNPGTSSETIVKFTTDGSTAMVQPDRYYTLHIRGNFYVSQQNTTSARASTFDLVGQNST